MVIPGHPTSMLKTLALLLAATVASGYFFAWLWRGWLIAALALSVFLLLSGGMLLANKNLSLQAVAIGVAIGAFIGSALGITAYL